MIGQRRGRAYRSLQIQMIGYREEGAGLQVIADTDDWPEEDVLFLLLLLQCVRSRLSLLTTVLPVQGR